METFDERVVVHSYYHSWFGGGPHRPRQLALYDAGLGRDVDFIFVSPTGLPYLRSRIYDDPGITYYLMIEGDKLLRIGRDSASDKEVSYSDYLRCPRPTLYQRVHNPSRSSLKLFLLIKQQGILSIYDQMDNWSAFAVQPWGSPEDEEKFIDAADGISTISAPLAHRLPPSSKYKVIPNGYNSAVIRRTLPTPMRLKPQVTYIGAMWPDWIDWSLIERTISTTEFAHFTFVGATAAVSDENDGRDTQQIVDQLKLYPNVTFVGEVSHDEVASYLHEGDIGLVPFLVNDVTTPCSPLKVYEYLGAGMSVLSTKLPEISYLQNVFAVEADAWTTTLHNMIRASVRTSEKDVDHYRELHSWSARGAVLDMFTTELRA